VTEEGIGPSSKSAYRNRGRVRSPPNSTHQFYTMEQTSKRSPGRPKKTPAPATATATKPKVSKVKRKLADETKLPVLFETIGNKGGIYLKIKNKGLTVFDEETGKVRGLRYASEENSVFIDEQSSAASVSQVLFENKILIANYTQPNLIKFLDMHPGNAANGGSLFQRANKEANIEQELDNEFMVHDAVSLIKSRPIEELLPVAMALKIETNQKDLAIKRALVIAAKRKPAEFMSLVDSPMVNARSVVAQAFDFQIVEERNGGVVWFDTGKLIVSLPVGQDRVEILTRFAMTDKGASVLSEMEKQLEMIA